MYIRTYTSKYKVTNVFLLRSIVLHTYIYTHTSTHTYIHVRTHTQYEADVWMAQLAEHADLRLESLRVELRGGGRVLRHQNHLNRHRGAHPRALPHLDHKRITHTYIHSGDVLT